MNKKNKKTQIYEKINEISKNIGLSQEKQTIFEILPTENPTERRLHLKNGTWNSNEPWFAIDENQELHTLISIKSLNILLETLRQTQEENFNLKLEKTIWQHIPVDFKDVWVVAMDEIRNIAIKEKDPSAISINLERLVKNIKKKHPNLFVNLKDIVDVRQLPGNGIIND